MGKTGLSRKDRALVAALPEQAWRIAAAAAGQKRPAQVASLPDGRIALRRGPGGDVLVFTKPEWEAFLLGNYDDEFDDLF